MSITDELREWAKTKCFEWRANEILAVADRIDAEHEKQVTDAFTKGAIDGIDMAEHSIEYVKLPVDADGELIRTGDMMQIKDCDGRWCGPFKVLYPVLTGVEWKIVFNAGTYAPEKCRHYHALTVKDVLREFALEVAGKECMTVRSGVVDKYAAKLRLADDEKGQQ